MSSSRPSWMEGGVQRPKAPPPAQTPSQHREERVVVQVPDQPGTHRNVVVGVTILTFLTLFSVFFWLGIGLAGAVNPPEAEWSLLDRVEVVTFSDYLSFGRITFATGFGVVGSLVTWLIADNLISL